MKQLNVKDWNRKKEMNKKEKKILKLEMRRKGFKENNKNNKLNKENY